MPSKPPPPDMVRLRVCLSPGCTADGAVATLEKMKALAPAHVIVEAGSCASLCGSGPVVLHSIDNNNNADPPRKEKRVQDKGRILHLLYPSGGAPADLVKGYDLVQQGDAALEQENYAQAVESYEQAVNIAFRSAVELEHERDYVLKLDQNEQERTSATTKDHKPSLKSKSTTTRIPEGLEWLIRARRHEARCKLKLGDVDGAMLAAQASCNLSRNTCAESFLQLADIYRLEGGLEGEFQALEKTLSLWSDDGSLSFAQKNQRRIASLRLQKVQRKMLLAEPKVASDDLEASPKDRDKLKEADEIKTPQEDSEIDANGASASSMREKPQTKQ